MRQSLLRILIAIIGIATSVALILVWSWQAEASRPNPPLPTAQWLVGSPPLQTILTLEVARSPREQTVGLAHRDHIGLTDGMAFPRAKPIPAAFWMRDMHFPLDLVFVGPAGRVLNVIHSAQPGSDDLQRATGPTSLVIEVPAGRAQLLGLVPGASIAPIRSGSGPASAAQRDRE